MLPLDLADNVHRLDLAGGAAMLDGDGKRDVLHVHRRERLHEHLGACNTARVGGDNRDGVVAVLGDDVFHKEGNVVDERVHVVHRRMVEEALNLATMEVERKHAVDARGLKQHRNVRCRDGHARSRLSVLSCVTVVGDDGSDSSRRCTAEAAHHQEELHERVVHRRAGGLKQEYVCVSHILSKLNVAFTIIETTDVGLAKGHS
mmetsp:Transcript_37567/g.77126  ORF Transcript_37567/g.77126 Transcript_37567/m.77126 type:complete len:203 (-) Transcript_37567:159-767(-)